MSTLKTNNFNQEERKKRAYFLVLLLQKKRLGEQHPRYGNKGQ